jgi:membrane protease YdiL (CAAX protease family)
MTPDPGVELPGTPGLTPNIPKASTSPMLDALYALIATAAVLAVVFGLVYWGWKAKTDRSAIVGIYLLLGLPAGLLTVAGAALMTTSDLPEGPFILTSGIALMVPLLKSVRKLVARFTPMDPNSPIDLLGFAVMLLIGSLLIVSAFQSDPPEPGQGGEELTTNPAWLVINALTFVAIAYLAVGFRIHRTGPEATDRLGINFPDLRTILISIAMVVPCMVVAGIGSALTQIFQPDIVDNIDEAMDQMTQGLNNPMGALLIGLSAGIGEEVLFRGAFQPRFGIVLSALFWTCFHVQYDITFVAAGLFGIGILLGLQRKFLGTTSAIITHALFNILVVIIGAAAS